MSNQIDIKGVALILGYGAFSLLVGVEISRPITLRGAEFIRDYEYATGYQKGKNDYAVLKSTIAEANVHCTVTGQPVLTGLLIAQATITLDEIRPMFVCPDNSDRRL